MAPATSELVRPPCLKFKGNLVAITTLELLYYDPTGLSEALEEKIAQAPALFTNHPIILSLEKYDDAEVPLPDLRMIQSVVRNAGMILVGIRADAPEQISEAQKAGLPVFPPAKNGRSPETTEANAEDMGRSTETSSAPKQEEAPATRSAAPAELPTPQNLVITQPVRSGQQIYARGGDLIVLAPVSAGAELLADGNIHVYAPLRGRALAGVRGLESARIFCQSLEAELVSIAGQYKISEDLTGPHWKRPTQITLNGEKLSLTDI
ncbi:MAG: septum site-determining protein MinC [Hahellaceae bacterium]|jgi:septum site-determining protein MinC|nr:septum site-determining protein MinC [Hahellaceae bacterium]